MAARSSSSTVVTTGPERRKSGIKETSPEDQARRAVIVGEIKEATPLQMLEPLASLEDSGEIVADEDIIQDDVAADEAFPEMDSDVDPSDEDKPSEEEWEDDGAILSDSDAEQEPGGSAFRPLRFEIVVNGATCNVPIDARWVRNHARPRSDGQKALYELNVRIWTLKRIADWLTARRQDFLRQRDLWCLGCEALEDIRQGRIPVEQKSFLACAGLNSKVSEDSLSRFIRATDIAWTDGSAPLDIIFSAAVRRAWVANAVRQFVEAEGEKVTDELLAEYESVKVKRDEKADLAKKMPDAMGLPTFIQRANMLARTQWAEVIAQYGDRMKG